MPKTLDYVNRQIEKYQKKYHENMELGHVNFALKDMEILDILVDIKHDLMGYYILLNEVCKK